jgi:hypothetical protein
VLQCRDNEDEDLPWAVFEVIYETADPTKVGVYPLIRQNMLGYGVRLGFVE